MKFKSIVRIVLSCHLLSQFIACLLSIRTCLPTYLYRYYDAIVERINLVNVHCTYELTPGGESLVEFNRDIINFHYVSLLSNTPEILLFYFTLYICIYKIVRRNTNECMTLLCIEKEREYQSRWLKLEFVDEFIIHSFCVFVNLVMNYLDHAITNFGWLI